MRYTKDPRTARSLRYSLRDAVAYSIMAGGAETYFSAFAVFLWATESQIALLATLPLLIGSLAQLLSAWIGHKLNCRKPIIVFGAALQALVLPLLVILPLVFPSYAISILLVGLTVYFGAAHLTSPQWTSLMGDLVPERRRGRFFAHRTRLATITAFASLCIAGVILHLFDQPQEISIGLYALLVIKDHSTTLWGFVIIFFIAFIARIVSALLLNRMHEPYPHAASVETPRRLRWLRQPEFRPALYFSLFFILMQSSVGVASPFFTFYMLKVLDFTYLEFMANTGISVLIQFITLGYWGRISDAMGNRVVLVSSGSLITILPLLWLIAPNFWYLLLVQSFSGICWAGFSLSAGNILYDLIPREKRASYQALQSVLLCAGVFLGSMLGALLIKTMPSKLDLGLFTLSLTTTIIWALVVSSLLRLLVAVYFLPHIKEKRKARYRVSATQLVFRVTRFNALMGLVYEIVTKIRKKP